MKRLLTLALCLTFSIPALAQLIVHREHLSTQRPSIQVLHDGKPAANLPVEIGLSYSRHPDDLHSRDHHLKLVTDAKGNVTLPRLRIGDYWVDVRVRPHLEGLIFLVVVPGKKNRRYAKLVAAFNKESNWKQAPRSWFSIDLSLDTFGHWLKQPSVRLASLHGTVDDPTGAVFPREQIDIYKTEGSQDHRIMRLRTNRVGDFSAALPSGEYLVVFHCTHSSVALCKEKAQRISIAKGASNEPLDVKLTRYPNAFF